MPMLYGPQRQLTTSGGPQRAVVDAPLLLGTSVSIKDFDIGLLSYHRLHPGRPPHLSHLSSPALNIVTMSSYDHSSTFAPRKFPTFKRRIFQLVTLLPRLA